MTKLETLYELFPEQSREAINALADDPDFQKQLPALILARLEKTSARILPIEKEMLPLFFARASFADTEEAYQVANLFRKYFSHQTRFLPLAVDFLENLESLRRKNRLTETAYHSYGQDFASRCLFSLSLFYEALEKRHTKHSAPHPGFYREMGKRTFDRVGQEAIAYHFEEWEEFIREKAFT